MAFGILRKKIGIEKQVDDFLDQVSEAGLFFYQGVEAYLKARTESFEKKLATIAETEHRGDSLRRDLEERLYRQTLIPESRGDVLELLENTDSLLDRFKGALWRFDIEQPVIPPEFHEDFLGLAKCAVEAVEAIVRSARAFFKNIDTVADHMHKVSFWESESDRTATRLQKNIFRKADLDLCEKSHMRDFARHIDKICDVAVDVADRLSIYVIKRPL